MSADKHDPGDGAARCRRDTRFRETAAAAAGRRAEDAPPASATAAKKRRRRARFVL
jgi:hypothetical protein